MALLCLKGVGLWFPAVLFWSSLALGAPIFDLRSDEEVAQDEHEARRVERFFGVDGIDPEDEYLAEWSSKEEALTAVVDKLFRSQRFAEALILGADTLMASDEDGEEAAGFGTSPGQRVAPKSRRALSSVEADAFASAVEVSYVMPPPPDDEDSGAPNTGAAHLPWSPRVIIGHRGGALALVTLAFEHVEKGKDRVERWTCTALRADLVASLGGEAVEGAECICDLRGPPPHGVRYLRM